MDKAQAVAVFKVDLPAHRWQWRDRDGNMHDPSSMETRHLFYTLRMIWNHSMPLEVGHNVRRYRFGPHYSPGYMAQGIRFIGSELMTRTDLTPTMISELRQMARFLFNRLPAERRPFLELPL